MLRIGPNASSDEQSAINIRTDTQRIGVQKNPTGEYILDVSGSINCDSIFVGGSEFTGSGGGVWTQDASDNISYSLGNVGISTTDPSYALDVSGDMRASGELYASGDLYADSDLYASGDLYTTDGDLLLTGDISMEGDVLTTGDMVLDGSMVIGKSSFDSSGYALDVSGAINCTELLVNGAAFQATSTTSNSDISDLNIEGNLSMGASSSITVAGNLNIGVDASFASSATAFTYSYLRLLRKSNAGVDLVINGLQVWQNDENIVSNPNLTDNSLNFYDSSDSLDSAISIGGGILETITSRVPDATYAWDFRESLTDFNGGETITLTNTSLISGTGVTFDGSTTYATAPTTVQAGGSSTFAVEIYFTYTGSTTYFQSIIDFEDRVNNNNRFRFAITNTSSIYVRGMNSSGNDIALNGIYSVTAGTQYHVVLSWINSTTMYLYVNGGLISFNTVHLPLNSYSAQMIGDNVVNSAYQNFYGTIHTLRFWNDPSSFDATDVANLYANRDVLTSNIVYSPSLTSIGSYAQLTFPVPPNYDDLQGIYLVSSNTTNYELEGCSIQLLDASYETVAESEVLGEAANYLMRGPADITSASGITISDATESYTNTASGALFSSPGDIVGWNDFSTYVDDVSLNEDSLTRSRSQAFALTVGEDLIVNGDTTVNGHMDVCGNVGIGTSGVVSGYALDVSGDINTSRDLHVDGTAYASGSALTSDDRLKHNEEDISGLELITQLHPQKYLKTRMMYAENYALTEDASGNYTNLKQGDRVDEEMGIIAQDVLNIPELSFCVADSTPYAVNYNNLFVLSIQAIKELKAKNDALQTSHDALQTSHDTLQTSHDALQTSHDALKALLQSKGLLD